MADEAISGQLLAGIIDSIEDGAAIYDADDRLVQFNERYTQYFQLIRDLLQPGISFREMFQALGRRGLYDGPESGLADWVASRVQLFAEGRRGNEFQRVAGNWVRVDYYKLRGGGTFVVTADITQRRQVEAALQQAHDELERRVEERTAELDAVNQILRRENAERRRAEADADRSRGLLADALENVSDGVILFNADERLVHCNARYRELYPEIADALIPGSQLEALVRLAAERVRPQEDLEAWVQDRLRQFRTGGTSREHQLADGRWIVTREHRARDGGIVGLRSAISEPD